jgi:hypothetical protein
MGNNLGGDGKKKKITGVNVKPRSKSFNTKSKRNNNEAIINPPSTTSSNVLITKTHPFEQDYSIIKTIGEGMNGKVHLCQSKEDKKKYALKVSVPPLNAFVCRVICF